MMKQACEVKSTQVMPARGDYNNRHCQTFLLFEKGCNELHAHKFWTADCQSWNLVKHSKLNTYVVIIHRDMFHNIKEAYFIVFWCHSLVEREIS